MIEKIAFPTKPEGHTDILTDRQTYIQTDIQNTRRTDISSYRVALLLKVIIVLESGG